MTCDFAPKSRRIYFRMNNFGPIIENKTDFFIIKIKVLLLKLLNRGTENKNEPIIKFLNFCSTFISLIEIEQDTDLPFILLLPFVLFN